MLELGVYVAASDGQIDEEEADRITNFLESQFRLDREDARRLQALKSVLQRRPPSVSGLGRHLQKLLKREQRESLGSFLTGIATANGIIARKEVTALRNAYKALDIDLEHLNRSLEAIRLASQEPVEIQTGVATTEGAEQIPPRRLETKRPGFRLDENRLGQIMRDTQEVGELLRAAMLEESSDEEHETETPGLGRNDDLAEVQAVEDSRLSDLDGRFHAILMELLERPFWTKAELDLVARRHKLMPLSACEAINTWSEDCLSDLLILEQGAGYAIQSQLFKSETT